MIQLPDSLFGLAPQRVAEEVQVISVLRQELRNSHEDPDGESRPPIEPLYRTVDAATLRVLKHPSYPFLVCEEAPAAYQAPIPYNAEEVTAAMHRQLDALEEHLQTAYRAGQASRRGSTDSCKHVVKSPDRQRRTNPMEFDDGEWKGIHSQTRYTQGKETATLARGKKKEDAEVVSVDERDEAEEVEEEIDEEAQRFFTDALCRDTCFAGLAREASVLRWYVRWVVSHSLVSLEAVREQLEYVLGEDGIPGEAELRYATSHTTFVAALSVLEGDRRDVVEAERHRMRSRTRTFRENLSPAAITAATNSYLTPEEKYRFQEFYNQTEHVLTMLRHAMHVQYSAKGSDPSIVHSREPSIMGSRGQALSAIVRDADADEVRCLADAAMRALREERDVITRLLRRIHERAESGTVLGISQEQYDASRLAIALVYKCVLEDVATLRAQLRASTDFLMRYDRWLIARCGADHRALLTQCAERAERDGLLLFPVIPNARQPLGWRRPNGASTLFVAAPPADVSPSRERSLSTSYVSASGQLPRHVEEVCDALMELLQIARQDPNERRSGHHTNNNNNNNNNNSGSGNMNGPSMRETAFRRWFCLALRHTCVQVVRGRWPADLLLAGMDDIAANLTRLVAESHANPRAAESRVAELAAVLRCLLARILGNGSNGVSGGTKSRRVADSGRYLNIPIALHLGRDADLDYHTGHMIHQRKTASSTAPTSTATPPLLDAEDEERWGALFDALWFQADPSSCAHGGLLVSVDRAVDGGRGFGFLRLDHIALPERLPRGNAGIGKEGSTVYITLQYAIQFADMSPARSLTQVVQDNATALPSTSIVTRYGYVRRVLHILSLLERRQLLQDYACRTREVDLVPLESVVYFSRQRDDVKNGNGHSNQSGLGLVAARPSSTSLPHPSQPNISMDDKSAPRKFVTVVGIVPPAAVQLMRYNALAPGVAYPASPRAAQTLSSLGLLIGNMLVATASCGVPSLETMLMLGETVREEAQWELDDHDGERRREGSVSPTRNREDAEQCKALVLPLLRSVDDYISSAAFDKLLTLADDERSRESESTPLIKAHELDVSNLSGGDTRRQRDSLGTPNKSEVLQKQHSITSPRAVVSKRKTDENVSIVGKTAPRLV